MSALTLHGEQTLPVGSLVLPPDTNPNVMRPGDWELLCSTIERDGFTQPILVRSLRSPADREVDVVAQASARGGEEAVEHVTGSPLRMALGLYEIIDGVHRHRAVKHLGFTDVSCIVVNVTPEQAKALRISMNRLRGDLDLSIVAREFQALAAAGWAIPALAATGFSPDEVEALLAAGAAQTAKPSDEMPDSFAQPPEPRKPEQTDWTLELTFDSRETLNRVKRRLRKLAGKGAPLEAGLLKALAED